MKQTIITLIVVAVLGYGYYQLRSIELGFSVEKGETREVKRGDITIPISATGVVGPVAWYEVKSKASGEVIKILRAPGELVKKGDLIIRLDKAEEQRMVDRSQAEATRAKALFDQAQIKLERLKTIGRQEAQALVDQLTARLEHAEFQYHKVLKLDAEGRASEDEIVLLKTNYDDTRAQLSSAQAKFQDIDIQIQTAEKDVILTNAAYERVLSDLGDAEERLEDTDIFSPVDGIVTQIRTQVGAVIQGGKTTFTGGTVLAVIGDVSKLYVRTEVDEADIGTVRDLAPEWARPGNDSLEPEEIPIDAGAPVRIHVDSFHAEEFAGIIERIHPEPNSTLSSVVTYQVDVVLTSDNRAKLLIGMQADVEFTAQSALDVLLVPHDAIRRNDFGDLGAYVPKTDAETGQIDKEFVKCRFGLDNGMFAEVLEGLQEGQKVFTVLPQKVGRDREKE